MKKNNIALSIIMLFFMACPPKLAKADGLADYLWQNWVIVVMADSTQDPLYQRQLALLKRERETLDVRDIVILSDSNPQNPSDLRKRLRPNGFTMVLIGKDGKVKLRKARPWEVREITRIIDK